MKVASRLVPMALLLMYVAFWVCFPSQNPDADALNELQLVEAPTPTAMFNHPAAEPSVWVVYHTARWFGYEGRAIRVGQLWNAAFLTLALVGVWFFLRRAGTSGFRSLLAVSCLAGCFSALHFAIDPYLLYWPPGLAFATWGLVFAQRGEGAGLRSFLLALLCLALAGLYNPMCAVFLLPAAGEWGLATRSERGSVRWVRVGLLGLVPALITLGSLIAFLPVASALEGPYGQWVDSSWRDAWQGITGALATPTIALWSEEAGAPLGRELRMAALGLTGLAALLGGGAMLSGKRRLASSLPWLIALVVSATFITWWSSGWQFWILPLWIFVLGSVRVATVPERSPRRAWPGATLVVNGVLLPIAAILWTANVVNYAWPAHRDPSPACELAATLAAELGPEDVLLMTGLGDYELEYYGELKTTGLIEIFLAAGRTESTFHALTLLVFQTRQKGGTVYFREPVDHRGKAQPYILKYWKDRLPLDFDQGDFERLQWGRTLRLQNETVREILFVKSSARTQGIEGRNDLSLNGTRHALTRQEPLEISPAAALTCRVSTLPSTPVVLMFTTAQCIPGYLPLGLNRCAELEISQAVELEITTQAMISIPGTSDAQGIFEIPLGALTSGSRFALQAAVFAPDCRDRPYLVTQAYEVRCR